MALSIGRSAMGIEMWNNPVEGERHNGEGLTAAWDSGVCDLMRAQAGHLCECICQSHLLGRAWHVDCDAVTNLGPFELVQHEVAHKLYWLVQGEPGCAKDIVRSMVIKL